MTDPFANMDMNKVTVGEFMKLCIDNASEETKREYKIKYCVKQLLKLYRTLYLNAYETLLIQKLKTESRNIEKEIAKQHLITYYRFIIAFDFEPLLDFEDDNYSMFNTVCGEMLCSDCIEIEKQLCNIVEKHYKAHDEIDRLVMNIACTDPELKPIMVQFLQYSNTRRLLAMSATDLQRLL